MHEIVNFREINDFIVDMLMRSINFFTFSEQLIWNTKQAWVNFISSRPIFRTCNFTYAPNWTLKTKVRVQSTKPMFSAFYYLRKICSFTQHVNVVRMSKIGCLPKYIFILKTHPSKGVLKNMLKGWNFPKNKLHHRCFDKNL